VGSLAAPAQALERLDEALRADGMILTEPAREALGWSAAEAERVLRALGFRPVRRPETGAPIIWRRRRPRNDDGAPAAAPPASPFAALAALRTAPARRRRRKPRAKHG
jgi:ATP-dependent RNA helicase SUPV3L1/SUV3